MCMHYVGIYVCMYVFIALGSCLYRCRLYLLCLQFALCSVKQGTVLPDCVAVGTVKRVDVDGDVQCLLNQQLEVDVHLARKFLCVVVRNTAFACSQYTRVKSVNNYTVCYRIDGHMKYGLVRYFLALSDSCVPLYPP